MDLAYLLNLIEEGTLTPKSLSKVSYIIKEMGMSYERKFVDFSIFLQQMLKKAEDVVYMMKLVRYSDTRNIMILTYAYNFIKRYIAPFIIIRETKSKLVFLTSNPKDPSIKVYNTINDFIKMFRDIPLGDLITEENDNTGAGEVFKTYMNFLYENLSNKSFLLIENNLVEDVYLTIESYINRLLYDSVFPTTESEEDKALHAACKKVCWVEPINLDIKDKDLLHGPLKEGITCIFII